MKKFASRRENDLDIRIPGMSSNKWQEVMSKHERNTIVFEIREEIISKVLDKCYKIYLKKRSVDILVDCAEKAWTQIISLCYYKYSHMYSMGWTSDEVCPPCPHDSMAARCVQVKKIDQDIYRIVNKPYESSTSFEIYKGLISEITDDNQENEESNEEGLENFSSVSLSEEIRMVNYIASDRSSHRTQFSNHNKINFSGTTLSKTNSSTTKALKTKLHFNLIPTMKKDKLPLVCMSHTNAIFENAWLLYNNAKSNEMIRKHRRTFTVSNYKPKKFSVLKPFRLTVCANKIIPKTPKSDNEDKEPKKDSLNNQNLSENSSQGSRDILQNTPEDKSRKTMSVSQNLHVESIHDSKSKKGTITMQNLESIQDSKSKKGTIVLQELESIQKSKRGSISNETGPKLVNIKEPE